VFDFLPSQSDNILAMHGTRMTVWYASPILARFGKYLIPLLIGGQSRDRRDTAHRRGELRHSPATRRHAGSPRKRTAVEARWGPMECVCNAR
jgi:hypothetical protein